MPLNRCEPHEQLQFIFHTTQLSMKYQMKPTPASVSVALKIRLLLRHGVQHYGMSHASDIIAFPSGKSRKTPPGHYSTEPVKHRIIKFRDVQS